MRSMTIEVRKELCVDCGLALRRFIGHLEGVGEVEIGDGEITISYDEGKIGEAELLKISRDSVARLGYDI